MGYLAKARSRVREGGLLALLAAACQFAMTSMRSYFWAKVLRTDDLRVGPGCKFIGGRNVTVASGLRVQESLWLEAIAQYGAQRFEPEIRLGRNVHFSRQCHVTGIDKITIGNNVLFGSNVFVSDHNHGCYKGIGQSSPDEPPAQRRLAAGGQVVIEDNVWLGDNVVVLGPVVIGRGSVVGANSVVTSDVAPFTVALGAPARAVKRFDESSQSWLHVRA